jgi:hypothetical protein
MIDIDDIESRNRNSNVGQVNADPVKIVLVRLLAEGKHVQETEARLRMACQQMTFMASRDTASVASVGSGGVMVYQSE